MPARGKSDIYLKSIKMKFSRTAQQIPTQPVLPAEVRTKGEMLLVRAINTCQYFKYLSSRKSHYFLLWQYCREKQNKNKTKQKQTIAQVTRWLQTN